MKKIFSFFSLSLIMLLAGTSSAWADSFQIVFSVGSSGDGTTASTNTACSEIVSEGSSYLTGNLVTATKVYYSGSDGLKLGTSSAGGTLKMNLSSTGCVNATSVDVYAKYYNSSKKPTLSINGTTAQSITSEDFTQYTFSVLGNVNYLELTTNRYCWVEKIVVTYSSTSTYLKGSFNSWGTTNQFSGNFTTVNLDRCTSYEFKIQDDNTWYGNAGTMDRSNCTGWTFSSGAGNCTISTDVAGNYVFAYDPDTKQVSVTYPDMTWGVKGSWDSWTDETTFTSGTLTLELTAGTTYEFKILSNSGGCNSDGYWSNDGTMTRSNCSEWTFSQTGNNCHITADVTGTYTFNFDINTKKLTVLYPTILTVTPSAATAFAATCQMPSDSQSFAIAGDRLQGDVTISVSGNAFKLSKTGAGDWTSSLTYTKDANGQVNETCYVRLESDLGIPTAATTPRSATVTIASTGISNQTISLSGTISAPGVTVKMNDQGTNYSVTGKRLCTQITEKELKDANSGFSATPCSNVQFSHFTTNPANLSEKVTFPYDITSTDAITFYAVYKSSEDGNFGGTIDFDVHTIATAESWINGTAYTSYTKDGVTITYTGGGDNGKYYNYNDSWRVYSGGTIAITSTSTIASITTNPELTFTKNSDTNWSFTASAKNEITSYSIAIEGSYTYELAPCGPAIRGTDNISVTGVVDGWVRSMTDIDIVGERLPDNVTIAATVLSGPFKVRETETSSTGVSSLSLVTGHTGASYTHSIALIYQPTAYNSIDNGEIELKVYTTGGTTVHAKCTLNVQGRSLPQEFVIAANTGSGWVALPNTMATTLESTGSNAAYAIEVDDATDPTKATLAPTTAVYGATGRASTYAQSAQSGVRFTAAGGYLQGSANEETKLWLPTTNAEFTQSWYLASDNLKDYNVYLSNRSNDSRHLAYNSTEDALAHYTTAGTVRFLPIEAKCTRFDKPLNLRVASKTSTTVSLTWVEVENATVYEYSTDGENWSGNFSTNAGTVTGLTPGTNVTIYIRCKVGSGTNCSDVNSVNVVMPYCDSAPLAVAGTMSLTGDCGEYTIEISDFEATVENATQCPVTSWGVAYALASDGWSDPAKITSVEFATSAATTSVNKDIKITSAGTYEFKVYATNSVGTSYQTAVATTVTVAGLAELRIFTRDNATTAPMINGKADLRVGASTYSPAPLVWSVAQVGGGDEPTIATSIQNKGLFSTTKTGVFQVMVSQIEAGGYCAATASMYIEVRNPNYYGYRTDCAVLNNNNIEVISISQNDVTFNIDDADVVQIEIVKENTGNGSESGTVAEDLFFSKYFEGAGSLKMLGIFNGTGADVPLANYKIGRGSNGDGSSFVKEYDLSSLGTIKKGQEIIFYTWPLGPTNPEYAYECSYDFLTEKANHAGADENPRWILCNNSAHNGITYETMDFSGDDPLLLCKNSTNIDVIGVTTDATRPAKNTICTNKSDESWYSEAVENMDYGKVASDFPESTIPYGVNTSDKNIPLYTARVIMFRKNTVVSGANAVTKNTTDFITLGEEWVGRQVCMDGNDGSLTCAAYQELGAFDYSDYFQRYEPVTNRVEKETANFVHNDDGSWTLDVDAFEGTSWEGKNFHDLACSTVQINGYKNGDIVTSLSYKVPIIVDVNTDTKNETLFGFDGQGRVICPDCDVVIRDSKKLDVVVGGYNDVRDIWVYSGASLNIPDAKPYTVRKLTIESENNAVGYTLVDGSFTAENGIVHTKRIDAQAWYDFSLPYSCKVSEIIRTNGKSIGTYGTDWIIKYYDGQKRANNGTPQGAAPTNWEVVAESGTLEAGVGYIVALGGVHDEHPNYKVRFVLPNKAAQPYTETAVDVDGRNKAVKGYSGAAATRLPCHKGWNYIGSPYVSLFDGADQTSRWDASGLLLNGYYTDGLLGTTYDVDEYNDLYVAIDEGVGTTDWVQHIASEATIPPFRAFFVQAVSDGNVNFAKAARTLPQLAPIARRANDVEVVSEMRLVVSNSTYGSDKTTIKLHSDFTDAYDLGYDMTRMLNNVSRPQPFTLNATDYLAYNAVNRETAETSDIPVGVKTKVAGEYTFSIDVLKAMDDYSAIYLIDKDENNMQFDLLQGSYTTRLASEVNTTRFALRLVRKEGVPTDLSNDEIQKPLIYREGDAVVIDNVPQGATIRLIDAIGRVLQTKDATEQTLQFHLPVRGVYLIQIMTDNGNYSIKAIL